MMEPEVVSESKIAMNTRTQRLVERFVFRDPHQDYWTNVILSVSLAEALLPFQLYACTLAYRLVTGVPINESYGTLLAQALACLCLGLTMLFAVTLLVASLVTAGVGLVCKSMAIDIRSALVGAFTGGCIGLLLSLPFAGTEFPALLLLSMATLLGQLGGTHGSWRTFHRHRRHSEEQLKIRFGVKQLLMLTFWLAITLTLLKLTDMTTANYQTFFGSWIMLQAAGLTAILLFERLSERKIG